MSGTRQPHPPHQSRVPTSMVRFRVLDLRARRQTTNLEHMRPYCVLRLGDQHYRTASFPPEGLGQVPARRTTADDRQHSVPDTEDVSSSGIWWEVPMSWTNSPRDGGSCHPRLGYGWENGQGKVPQKQEGVCRDADCTEITLEIYNRTDLDSGMSIEGFDTEMVGVLRVKLSDVFADHGVHTEGDSLQVVANGHAAATKPGGQPHDHPDASPNAETRARLTRFLRHRRDRWFGGVLSPTFCSQDDLSGDSCGDNAASSVVVEARLEVAWDGCGTDRSAQPVYDSFGQAVDPRNFRKCLSAQSLWMELREPLQRARWNSDAGRAAWAAFRARCRHTEPIQTPMKNIEGRQDWEGQLRELVWNGVPAELREDVYMSLSGASSKLKLFGSGHYETLVGKCQHLEDDIDDSEVARKRGHERADSPTISAERPKSLRQREESMPAETRCVEPTRSVEPAHSAFHRTPLYGAINSKVSHEFPGDKAQFSQSSNSSSPLGNDADHCPYSSNSAAENITEGTERVTGTLGGQISECGVPMIPRSVSVNVADVSSGPGVDHSLQGGGLGDDQGDSSSADWKPQTLHNERPHEEIEGTSADTAQAAGDSAKKHAHEIWREIEADLDRVFVNGRTRVNSAAGMASMRRILRAYSLHNPAVGYCQGMNFVAGLLLEVVPEETAFWLLVAFCEDLHPGYHTKSMMGARSDIAALKDIVRRELPRFHTRASEVHMPLELKLTQWLLVGFVNCFPPNTALRILEVSFLEGSDVYLATALGFLRLHEEEIMHGEDIADVVYALDRAQSGMYEADILLTQVWRELAVVGDAIRSAREWHRNRFIVQEGGACAHNRERGSHGDEIEAWHTMDEAADGRGGCLQGRSSAGVGSAWLYLVPKSLSGQVDSLFSTLNRKALTATHSLLVDGKVARPSLVPFVVGGVRWLLGWKASEPS